jgi:ABC-type sugar transport system ATPase subunit
LAAIELKSVSKSFGPYTACKDVTLAIGEGEFVTLLGASGCGKTTTLNMIAGLEDVSSGDILMNGRRVNDLSPVERDVAMVFQNYALYPHMTRTHRHARPPAVAAFGRPAAARCHRPRAGARAAFLPLR